tara:strand:- start:45 stop:752 length:708 start_codon:yes stop_codon:yes gene_type:complete
MASNKEKLILKFLSVLPQFLFKRIVNKLNLDKQNKNIQPSFNEIVSSLKSINKSLFDGDGELFEKYVGKSKIYGEYGVGVSTVFANKYKNKHTIAVDSDKNWILNIKKNLLNSKNLEITHIDLGKLKNWGTPEGYEYRHNFTKYLNAIWVKSLKPDLVLVDGRFRVACFLTSLLNADKGSIIIFDDYISRPEYHIVEIFEKPIETNSRQAAFKVSGNYDSKELKFLIEKFEFVFS